MTALAVAAGVLLAPFVVLGGAVISAVKLGMSISGKVLGLALKAGLLVAQIASYGLVPLFTAVGTAMSSAVAAGMRIGTAVATAAAAALGTAMEVAIAIGPFALVAAAIIAAIVLVVKNWGPIKKAVSAGVLSVLIFLGTKVREFGAFGVKVVIAILRGFDYLGDKLRGLFFTVVKSVLRFIGGQASAFAHAAGSFITGIVNGLRNGVSKVVGAARSVFNGIVGVFKGIGSAVGKAVAPIANFIGGLLNNVIRAVDSIIGAINSIPNVKTPFGNIGIPDIPKLPLIPKLARGGIATRSTVAEIGEGAANEAVLPLTRAVFDNLGESIARSLASYRADPVAASRGTASAPGIAGAAGDHHDHWYITAPAGTQPDVETTVALISKKMRTKPAAYAR